MSQNLKSLACRGLAATWLVALGCSSGPGAIAPPDVDPEAICDAVLADYDANGDGKLAAIELEAVPPIHDRLEAYDADKNGEVSLEELRARIDHIFDGKTGVMGAMCRVTHNGRPLAGAIVHFVPAPFFKEALPVASGVTMNNGLAQLSVRPEDLPKNAPKIQGLVRPGMYIVEVTHPSVKIPENYNVKSTLGREISAEVTIGGPIDLALKF